MRPFSLQLPTEEEIIPRDKNGIEIKKGMAVKVSGLVQYATDKKVIVHFSDWAVATFDLDQVEVMEEREKQ